MSGSNIHEILESHVAVEEFRAGCKIYRIAQPQNINPREIAEMFLQSAYQKDRSLLTEAKDLCIDKLLEPQALPHIYTNLGVGISAYTTRSPELSIRLFQKIVIAHAALVDSIETLDVAQKREVELLTGVGEAMMLPSVFGVEVGKVLSREEVLQYTSTAYMAFIDNPDVVEYAAKIASVFEPDKYARMVEHGKSLDPERFEKI